MRNGKNCDWGGLRLTNTNEIYFVFLGEKFPSYAKASLKLASETSGMNLCLIGNKSIERSLSGLPIRFIPVEEFYNPEEFQKASSHVWADHGFRGGFWLKSLERLFVIDQYMAGVKKSRILHSELDQLIFRADKLVARLESLDYSGLFVPFHNENSAVASILYVNDQSALRSLLEHASSDVLYPNEMHLIADWAKKYPSRLYELPTVASIIQNSEKSLIPGARLLSLNETGGLVDAAQVGQWVAGIDPKNLGLAERPLNKFVDAPSSYLLNREQLKSLQFLYDENSSILSIMSQYSLNSELYNLHIHSKIHATILSEKIPLIRLFDIANAVEPIQFPGIRKQQILGLIETKISRFLARPSRLFSASASAFNEIIGRRPSSSPFISGDSFRAIAKHVWETGQIFEPFRISSGDIIFCESDLLEDLQHAVLSQIKVPVILLLGNSDRNIDSRVTNKLTLKPGSQIFAQNLSEDIPGVNPLPTGLENRWRANNGKILPFRILRFLSSPRAHAILWGFSVGTNPKERTNAALALMKTPTAKHPGAVSSFQHQRLLSKFEFVASPPGKGIDTHRTWEAMYLGCIPILLDSYLSKYYKSIGLPLWVVDSYEDLIRLDERDLESKYQQIHGGFKSSELDFGTWKSRISNAAIKASDFKA